MKTFKFCILFCIVFLTISCSKSDKLYPDFDSNYIIFGHFHGECLGEKCVETFKLTDKKLYEDTNDDYSGGDYNFIELSENKFELVKNLKKDFPTELLSEPKTTFGCPDCADQGGLVIQYANNGTIKSWRVDKSKSQVPSYLHNYMDKIEAAIEQINK